MDPRQGRRAALLFLAFLASSILCLSAASLYRLTRPQFGSGVVQFTEKPVIGFVYPFAQKSKSKTMFALTQNVELSAWYPTVFSFYPEDALWSIKVNGHEITAKGLPLSVAHHEGRSINLAPYLHAGANSLECTMEVYWGNASLHLYISPWDKYSILISGLVFLAILTTAVFFYLIFNLQIDGIEMAILLCGFFLRYLYVQGTPYFTRSYDWWGHVPYLDYVAHHLSLPDAHVGWENYQPPLYYCLLGALTRLLFLSGMAEEQRYTLWQAISLLCSMGVLVVGFWIGRQLYPRQAKYRLYLLSALSVAPPLIFNASRVSNDVLVNLLAFLWLGFLLQFWQRPKAHTWLGLSITVALSLMTKANTLVFIPISLFCLILTKRELRFKKHMALALGITSVGTAGWYYLPRAFHENGIDSYIISNIHILNPKAHIDGVFVKSLVFNPFKILRYPFVEVWGPRHEYFLEYFFKTMFLGDWYLGDTYRWIARAFMAPPLLLIPPFLFGLWRSMRTKNINDTPLLLTFLGVFMAQWVFLQVAPFMCHQDFRFSVVLLIPIIYFLNTGVVNLSFKWQRAYLFTLQLVILNCAIYILELCLEG